MSEKNVGDRVTHLEAWREEATRRLNDQDNNLKELKKDTKDQLSELNTRIDSIHSNELAHVNQRISVLEDRHREPISWGDLAKIIIAVIAAAGSVLAAYVGYFHR